MPVYQACAFFKEKFLDFHVAFHGIFNVISRYNSRAKTEHTLIARYIYVFLQQIDASKDVN